MTTHHAVTRLAGEDQPLSDRSTAREAMLQYLTFSLGDEVFAIDIRCVRELIQHGAMTVVPLMPAFVRGVINLRGAVVPVIDLQSRFGRPPAQMGKKTCVIIFDVGPQGDQVELGLWVDAVSEMCIRDSPARRFPRHQAVSRLWLFRPLNGRKTGASGDFS